MTRGRPILLPALAVFAAVLAAGCRSESRPATPREYKVPTTGRSADTTRMTPKELHTFAAVSGVLAGAKAGKQEVARVESEQLASAEMKPSKAAAVAPVQPTPPAPVAPSPPAVIVQQGQTVIHGGTARTAERVTAAKVTPVRKPAISLSGVRSDRPHPSKEAALQDALQVVQLELMKEFQKLDPPVHIKPTISAIRSQYMRKDGVQEVLPTPEQKADWKSSNLETDRLWVKLDIEVSEDQVQRLRAGERVNAGLQVGGVLFAILLAAFGFFRLDAWTKGYLTSWLAIGAVALVVIAALVALS